MTILCVTPAAFARLGVLMVHAMAIRRINADGPAGERNHIDGVSADLIRPLNVTFRKIDPH